jgi:hypothetical protein
LHDAGDPSKAAAAARVPAVAWRESPKEYSSRGAARAALFPV